MKRNDILALNKALGTNFDPNSYVIGMDADYVAGAAVTTANGGIPAMLTTWLDPSIVDAIVAPMRMGEILPEVKKGDRADITGILVPMREFSGQVSTYGDFNDNGISGSNMNWVTRQPYSYQTHIKVGEIEIEIAAKGNYDIVGSGIESSVLQLNKFQNQTYIYGVDGLKNYGMLNDPALLPDSTGINWATATAEQLYNEVKTMFAQLVKQAVGNVKARDAMILILSPQMEAYLTATNQYGLNAWDLIAKNFPNLRVESVPEYATAAGEKLQLMLEKYNGRPVAELAFPDKLRVHTVEVKTSGWLQKRSQSTLGAIIYYPVFIAGRLATNTPA